MKGIARAALEVVRLAFARDSLGEAPPAERGSAKPPGAGILHVLFVSREPLGEEPPAAGRPRRPLLRWLFAPDELPFDPVPPEPPRRRGRVAALFAPEKLDDDSP